MTYVTDIEAQNLQLQEKLSKMADELAAEKKRNEEMLSDKNVKIWFYHAFMGGLVYEMVRRNGGKKVNVKKMGEFLKSRLDYDVLCGANYSFWHSQNKDENFAAYVKLATDAVDLKHQFDLEIGKKFDKMCI